MLHLYMSSSPSFRMSLVRRHMRFSGASDSITTGRLPDRVFTIFSGIFRFRNLISQNCMRVGGRFSHVCNLVCGLEYLPLYAQVIHTDMRGIHVPRGTVDSHSLTSFGGVFSSVAGMD